MLRKMTEEKWQNTKSLIALLIAILLLIGTAAAGYNENGVKGAIFYLFIVIAPVAAGIFGLAWIWRGICIANGLTPADIDEITKGQKTSRPQPKNVSRLPSRQRPTKR